MTALAVAEAEVAAERTMAGMTRRAGLHACCGEVLGRGGRTNLPCLRRARREFVAIRACESLARGVIGMTERVSISARVRARRTICFLIVTNSARRDLASGVRTARRRMT